MPISVKPKVKIVPHKPPSTHPKARSKAETINKNLRRFNTEITKRMEEKPKELMSSNITLGEPKSVALLLKDKCAKVVVASR